jgi:biopolymer transport protein ExbD
MKFRDHRSGAAEGKLQVAPLINVVFLLFVVYVVTWDFTKSEAVVSLASRGRRIDAAGQRGGAGDLVVTVMEDGSIGVNKEHFTKEELFAKLSRVGALFPGQPVILRGEANTAFENVLSVMDTCQKAGLWNVALASFQRQR